ncbi:C40 family peptidase [Ammoniphilus sp. 3BR4]|uniref:C40 family peptidase n=1 Tax=Ammoniphilus sp. 3BR4 TaxID=3158265 RepID=UPI0034662459
MKRLTLLSYTLAASVLFGSAMGQPSVSFAEAADQSNTAARVIAAGKNYIGTPYEFGSSRLDTSTFDCSDFIRQAFWDGAGMKLPSDSRSQAEYVKSVGKIKANLDELQPGDLLFFMSYKGPRKANYAYINKENQRVTHVGIYLGDGKLLHTYSKESGGVRIDTIRDKHWEYRMVLAGSAY